MTPQPKVAEALESMRQRLNKAAELLWEDFENHWNYSEYEWRNKEECASLVDLSFTALLALTELLGLSGLHQRIDDAYQEARKSERGLGAIDSYEDQSVWLVWRQPLLKFIDSIGMIYGLDTSKKVAQSALFASDRVFIVHGHDGALKNAVARFVELLGLKAVILHEQPNRGLTYIEKLEAEADAGFVVVLATADDLAASEKSLGSSSKSIPKVEMERRAMQTVIFQLGVFIGKHGRNRVALIADPDIQLPAEFCGVGCIHRGGWQGNLLSALAAADFTFVQDQMTAALTVRE